MLDSRRIRQIYQTMSCRLEEGKYGPPDSFSEEEKTLYREMEKSTLENRKNGRVVTYSFPHDYD